MLYLRMYFSGPGSGGDLHPGSAWLKCGEKGCRSKNFAYHSICHGVRVNKSDAKSFCEKFIRCSSHIKQKVDFSSITKDFETSSASDSDEAFMPRKKPKKSNKDGSGSRNSSCVSVSDTDEEFIPSKKQKKSNNNVRVRKTPSKVRTPGGYSLEAESRGADKTERNISKQKQQSHSSSTRGLPSSSNPSIPSRSKFFSLSVSSQQQKSPFQLKSRLSGAEKFITPRLKK